VSNIRVRILLGAFALLLAAIGGCAGYSPQGLQPGATQAEVIRQMGPPTGRYTQPSGKVRLEFARGPAGYETFMVNFEPDGRMIDWEQVMDLWYLTRIEPGLDVDDVLLRVGHPVRTQKFPRQQIEVWSYRYPTNDCLWFQISIGDDGKVVSGGQGIDPRCDPGDRQGGGR
jgi:hypothetical protein